MLNPGRAWRLDWDGTMAPALTARRSVPKTGASRSWETSMNFKPLHDRVLIDPSTAETKSKGGIIIPDTAQEKPQQGKVVAAGKGARLEDGRLIPLDVKVGDTVIYGKWSGTEVKLSGKDYVILKESDVMGVVA
jgi:chaperonin GroES